jgi:hypothetical protein
VHGRVAAGWYCARTSNIVAGERVGERGIKYGIVGIEYGIEITWVQEKWI